MSEKRVVKTEETKGFSIQDLIIVAVLLAAGAVLKLFVGSVINFFGMKPNFIIASYCLAILLVRPKLPGCAIIGILAGAICQFLPGTPWLNFISELLGAVESAAVHICFHGDLRRQLCGLPVRVHAYGDQRPGGLYPDRAGHRRHRQRTCPAAVPAPEESTEPVMRRHMRFSA